MEMPVYFQHKTYLNKYMVYIVYGQDIKYDILIILLLQGMTLWVSTTSSSLHSLKCKCCMILVRPNVLGGGGGLVFCFFTICLWCHFFNRCTKKKNGTGWKLMWRGRTVLNDVRKENMSLCTPLQPWGITQLDFRLFFPPSAHLISALARLFSFICFIPLYCHNVADPECSHRSLVQLISEVVLLQIGSLNLVFLHSFSVLDFQAEKRW